MKNILILDSVHPLLLISTLSEFYKDRAVVEGYQYEAFYEKFPVKRPSLWQRLRGTSKNNTDTTEKKYDVMFLSATMVDVGNIDVKKLLRQHGTPQTRIVQISLYKKFPKGKIKNEVAKLNKRSIELLHKITPENAEVLNKLIE